jgi:uncharacterized Zn finger protein
VIEADEGMLIRLAGKRAFGQGVLLFEAGCVGSFSTTNTRASAVVQDSHPRKVVLRSSHRTVEGECDCEVSDGIEFCQHCVAVALHLQELQPAAKIAGKRGAMRRIKSFLSSLTHEELLEEFLGTVKADRSLRDDLLQKATFASERPSYVKLKKVIDKVSPDDHLYEVREIRAYFQQLESVLIRLATVSEQLDPLVLLRVVEHAIRRLNEDLCVIDDFDYFQELSTDMLVDLHRKAIGGLNWAPNDLAEYLLDCAMEESWHPFDGWSDLYQDDLGEAFSQALAEASEARTGSAGRPSCDLG